MEADIDIGAFFRDGFDALGDDEVAASPMLAAGRNPALARRAAARSKRGKAAVTILSPLVSKFNRVATVWNKLPGLHRGD